MLHIPFAWGWYSGGIEGSRSCETTYCQFDYAALPPLPEFAASFDWLIEQGGVSGYFASTTQTEASVKLDEAINNKLDILAKEAEQLDVSLPASFMQFMRSPELRLHLAALMSWTSLSDHLIPCPGLAGAYLVGFQRDQQDCVTWALCLIPGDNYRMLALPMDVTEVLPERLKYALYGDLDFYDETMSDQMDNVPPGRQVDIAMVMESILICAPSFEAFVYHFCMENSINAKLLGIDKASLTERQQRYLDHYARTHAAHGL